MNVIGHLVRRAIAVAMLINAPMSWGAACLLVLSPGARVTVGTTEYGHHVRAEPCTAVRIVAGAVTACYRTNDGAKRCDDLRPGATFAIDAAGKPPADPSFAGVLFAMMKGDQRSVTGLVRAPPDLPAIAGLPYGDISVAAGELTLHVPGLSAFSMFNLDAAGPPLMRAANANGRVTLQPRDLQPGRRLRWSAQVNGRDYEGRLHAIAAQDEREVSDRLRAQPRGGSPVAAALLRAETLDELALFFQRDQVIREAGVR
ncbi:MAG: hypothetical protein ABI624_20000 [Casimicrobiaceae bacterium]